MAYVKTDEPAAVGKVHYAIEYSEPSGRRRRKRSPTLKGALRVQRGLPLGANSEVKLVVRKTKRA
jgi:hypothetical protein